MAEDLLDEAELGAEKQHRRPKAEATTMAEAHFLFGEKNPKKGLRCGLALLLGSDGAEDCDEVEEWKRWVEKCWVKSEDLLRVENEDMACCQNNVKRVKPLEKNK